MAPSARFPYAPPVRTLRPYPPPGEYPPPVTLPGRVDGVAPADKRHLPRVAAAATCVCCHGLIQGGFHSCKTCGAALHGIAMCDKQWMPSHGLYFCRPECIQEYNGREDVMAERVPLRSRPTSAEVEPVVASHIAPALPPQPGAAPSNVNLNPVPSACTLRPYPPPVLSAARSLHPYPPPLPSACALRPRPYFPPVS